MKQPKKSGRLLADVGEDLKRRFYKVLFEKEITYKMWLQTTIIKFLDENNA